MATFPFSRFQLSNNSVFVFSNSSNAFTQQPNTIFRIQTFEKQMLAEHCTTGLNVWVSPERLILVDCQPLLSASILDRSIQVDKKFSTEYNNSYEDSIEMHSLQAIGFLSNICHKLLVVQDHFVDPNLIRLIQTAEMLKPSSPALTVFDEEDPNPAVVDHFPDLVFVHNKAVLEDFSASGLDEMNEFYARAFSKSQFHALSRGEMSTDNGFTHSHLPMENKENELKVNLVSLPDFELFVPTDCGFESHLTFEDALLKFRRALMTSEKRPLSTAKLSEKAWFSHMQKSWENVKSSGFYAEYSRFLR